MKKYFLSLIMILTIFLATACGEPKKIICTRGEGTETKTEIVGELDSNNKIYKVDLRLIYPNNEQAQMDLEVFQDTYGSSVDLTENVITISNAHKLKDSAFSDVIGYSRDEFKSYFKSYTCE